MSDLIPWATLTGLLIGLAVLCWLCPDVPHKHTEE